MTVSTEAENQYPTKDPDAVLDFATGWSTWLAEGEVIETSEWLITSPNTATPVLAMSNDSKTDSVATVWLSGGVLGLEYVVVNRITTNQGRTEDRTKFVTIRQH